MQDKETKKPMTSQDKLVVWVTSVIVGGIVIFSGLITGYYIHKNHTGVGSLEEEITELEEHNTALIKIIREGVHVNLEEAGLDGAE